MPTPIKVIDVPSPATDGNTKQWDKLKAMRGEHAPEPTPQVVAAELAPTPAATEPAPRDPATGKFVAKEPEAAPVAATPPATPPAAPVAAPTSVEVDIDGQKVQLSPELAEAFTKAEKVKTDTSATSDRERLKAELREELRAELHPQKSQAEIAAEAALAAAEAERNKPKKPDAKLLISDPDEYERQRDTYEEWRVNAAKDEVKRSIQTDTQRREQTQAQAQEVAARQILSEQFYDTYPVLKDSADIVGPMLETQFNALIASGVLNKPLSAREKEDLKKTEFADVASKATRRLVKLMNSGKAVVPPPAPPPALVQSASTPSAKPPVKVEPKSTDKYPPGSMSAALAERRAKQHATG